jgi:hypothetical protein
VNATEAVVFPFTAVPIVGAPGIVDGVALLLAAEGALVPAELIAVTVKVYAVPFVRPETTTGDVAEDPVNPPGEDVPV